jgi:hypothetical protein
MAQRVAEGGGTLQLRDALDGLKEEMEDLRERLHEVAPSHPPPSPPLLLRIFRFWVPRVQWRKAGEGAEPARPSGSESERL